LSNKDTFLRKVKRDCADAGVKVYFPRKSQIPVNIKPLKWYKECAGWFCQIDKELVVWESPQMFPVLAHEYAHFLQWKEGYVKMRARKMGVPYSQLFNYWLDGLQLGASTLTQVANGLIQLEWNCEIRALDLMDEYGIVTNKRKYVTYALSVLYGYCYARDFRKSITTPVFPFLYEQADELIQARKLPARFPFNQAIYDSFIKKCKKL